MEVSQPSFGLWSGQAPVICCGAAPFVKDCQAGAVSIPEHGPSWPLSSWEAVPKDLLGFDTR